MTGTGQVAYSGFFIAFFCAQNDTDEREHAERH